MTYKNLVGLYSLDKKICQMICSIEGISKNFSDEWRFLDTLELYAKNEEEVLSAKEDMQRFNELMDSGRRLVNELLIFKRALNDYQCYKNHTSAMQDFFGVKDKDIDKELEAQKSGEGQNES
ncbi:hypothetical protein LS68_008010 [Helicobacter sp. MIT 05-5293]|uniref:hypothetical protein n=1 Tax=Helicobacter sp. MIT 05-5293 TaxID=1548149 RepID=UPI00051D1DD4|nr:hypothetical protein [Helicobacter sp. MIT 05-5293]TLD80152.1 hypothetical protein LS68_008010 [Helicobacter sp. MIT 05-5293]